MKIKLTRFMEIENGTIGKIEFDAKNMPPLSMYSLEPAGPDTTTPGLDRRIPQGEYKLGWHDSPKFKARLPLVYNEEVPKSRCILVHAGNYDKDTLGCILPGHSFTDKGVFQSKAALNDFLIALNYVESIDDVTLEIVNEFDEADQKDS